MKLRNRAVRALSVLVFLAIAGEAHAALGDLRAIYKKKLTEIESDAFKRQTGYRKLYVKKLGQIEAAEIKEGDLDAVLVLRKEKKRFQAQPFVTDNVLVRTPDALRKLQESYKTAVLGLPRMRAQRIVTLAEKYDKALEKLQVKLTREDDIEGALQVKQERANLQTSPELVAARNAVMPGARRSLKLAAKKAPAPGKGKAAHTAGPEPVLARSSRKRTDEDRNEEKLAAHGKPESDGARTRPAPANAADAVAPRPGTKVLESARDKDAGRGNYAYAQDLSKQQKLDRPTAPSGEGLPDIQSAWDQELRSHKIKLIEDDAWEAALTKALSEANRK